MSEVTLKFTIVGNYSVESDLYENGDPKRMAEIDQEELDSGGVTLGDLIEWAEERDITVKIEPESS